MFKRVLLIAFALFTLLQSCTKGHGNLLQSEKLDVYYESKEDEALASSLGHFWKNKGFLSNEKQTIRLSGDDEYYYVQIIASDPKNVEDLPYIEMKLLLELQNELDTTVFAKTKGSQILICDKEFKTLYNINH